MYLLGHERENRERQEREGRRGIFTRLHSGFEHGFEALRNVYANLLQVCLDHSAVFAAGFLAFCAASLLLYTHLGQDFFPAVDAGEFRLHLRAKTGTRIEETARVTDQVERSIRARIPASEMGGILDNIGLPASGINLSYSNSGVIGNADAEILVSLAAKHRPTEEYVSQLREALPKEFPGTTFFFQPADIVSQILNFGLPAPIDIQVIGSDIRHNFAIAAVHGRKNPAVPGAVDVHVLPVARSARESSSTSIACAPNRLVSTNATWPATRWCR